MCDHSSTAEPANAVRTLTSQEQQSFESLRRASALPIGLFESTATQARKSIIDANATIRSALELSRAHDYSEQPQGNEYKRTIPTIDLSTGTPRSTKTSLYRPETKDGDPRLWVYGAHLPTGHIFALASTGEELFLVDLSHHPSVETALGFLRTSPSTLLSTEEDLLRRLRHIAAGGPIPSPRRGDTAVGAAVEAALGIEQNSSEAPDWFGTEIKSYRTGTRTRKNLFAKVPKWSISPVRSSQEMLRRHGYSREGSFRLYCQVDATRPNSQGLLFDVDLNGSRLLEKHRADDGSETLELVWLLDDLNRKLAEKHDRTFWVAADPVYIDGQEHFQLREVRATNDPDLTGLAIQLASGGVSMDHLIKESNGRVTEKGPIFKAREEVLQSILTTTGVYPL